MATVPKTSSIGLALAGKSTFVDIPKPHENAYLAGRDNFTAVATKGGATAKHGMLPTPPNSISPTLPPQSAFKHHTTLHSPPSSSPPHVDSDIDLQDADGQPQTQQLPLSSEALDSLSDLDGAGAITPALLAKHHLPDILLTHGPLAIRHVMGYLTTSVPGFSRIPPAKARRLVVGALEGRGSGGEGAGVDQNVLFDKVGWGRWDARIRGQPSRDRQGQMNSPPPSLSSSHPNGMQIPGNAHRTGRARGAQSGTSFTAQSAFTHSEMDYDHDVDMLEHEADKMSMDGDEDNEYCSSSEAPDDMLMDGDLGEGDVTDEEDWANIGAAALKAKSFNTASVGSRLYQPIAFPSKSYNCSNQSVSKPEALAEHMSHLAAGSGQVAGFSFPNGVSGDSQEREAIEALLRLGSM